MALKKIIDFMKEQKFDKCQWVSDFSILSFYSNHDKPSAMIYVNTEFVLGSKTRVTWEEIASELDGVESFELCYTNQQES